MEGLSVRGNCTLTCQRLRSLYGLVVERRIAAARCASGKRQTLIACRNTSRLAASSMCAGRRSRKSTSEAGRRARPLGVEILAEELAAIGVTPSAPPRQIRVPANRLAGTIHPPA